MQRHASSSGAIGQRTVLIDRWEMLGLWVRASPGAKSLLQSVRDMSHRSNKTGKASEKEKRRKIQTSSRNLSEWSLEDSWWGSGIRGWDEQNSFSHFREICSRKLRKVYFSFSFFEKRQNLSSTLETNVFSHNICKAWDVGKFSRNFFAYILAKIFVFPKVLEKFFWTNFTSFARWEMCSYRIAQAWKLTEQSVRSCRQRRRMSRYFPFGNC